MNKLSDWSRRAWSSINNLFSLRVIVGRCLKVKKLWNTITNWPKCSTESLHKSILFWTLELIEFESWDCRLKLSPYFCSLDNHSVWRVFEICNWCQSYKNTKLILKITMIVAKSREHLGCSLGMTNIGNFIMASLRSNEVDLSWSIDLSKLEEAIVKEFCLISCNIWVQLSIFSTIACSSIVSKPNIEPCHSKLESDRFISIHDPCLGRWEKTMLKKYWIPIFWSTFLVDSKDCEDVFIASSHSMSLKDTSIFLDDLLEWIANIWIGNDWLLFYCLIKWSNVEWIFKINMCHIVKSLKLFNGNSGIWIYEFLLANSWGCDI